MKALIEKIKAMDIAIYVLVIIVVILGLIMPKTGELVLVDEFFSVLVVCIACIYILIKVVKEWGANKLSDKLFKIAVIIGCMFVSIWFAKNLVLDIFGGTTEVVLSNVQVNKYQGTSGIFSLHYYLDGTDEEGKRERFEISAEDYTRLSHAKSVVVEYYEHTERVVDYR